MLVQAERLAHEHYENFPVAPFFLPRQWRKPIGLIYAFARTADDYADEGDFTPEIRLAKLNGMEQNLADPHDAFFDALTRMIEMHQLPIKLFHDLLSAFKQDVVKSRYHSADEVLNYCSLSAHPIGRLLLQLTGFLTEKNAAYSDKICAALQLINFLQDIHSDLIQRDRLYIPQVELDQFKVTETDLIAKQNVPGLAPLIQLQWQRAFDLLQDGSPLLKHLKGRFRWMIALTIAGGAEILHRLQLQHSVFERPTLNKLDWLTLTYRVSRNRIFPTFKS